MKAHRKWVPLALTLALTPIGACSDSILQTQVDEVVLEIQPRQVTLVSIGDTAKLEVSLVSSSGERITPGANDSLDWSSADPEIAVVHEDGTVEAVGNGQTTVRGVVRGQADSATVVVTQTPARVEVDPDSVTLTEAGSTVQLAVQVFDGNDVSIPGAEVSWHSTDPAVAGVDDSGKVVGYTEGVVAITASVEDAKPDTVVVHVNPDSEPEPQLEITVSPNSARVPVGADLDLQVTVESNGTPTNYPELSWNSLNPEVASVNIGGSVTARSVGTALIIVSAVCCGTADTAEVTVFEPDTSDVEPLFADDFESYADGESVGGNGANGFRWTGGGLTVSDADAYSGNHSLYFPYAPVEPNGDSHWWSEQRFQLAPDAASAPDEVWVQFWVRVPDNFTHRDNPGSPENNKLFAIWAEDYSRSTSEAFVVLEYVRDGSSGDSRLRIASAKADGYESRDPDDVQTIRGTLFNTSMRGRWVRIRIHVRVAVNGSIVDVWRDDEKIAELPSDYSAANPSWSTNYLRHGYILGYDNSGFDEQTNFYVDNFVIYTSDPGW